MTRFDARVVLVMVLIVVMVGVGEVESAGKRPEGGKTETTTGKMSEVSVSSPIAVPSEVKEKGKEARLKKLGEIKGQLEKRFNAEVGIEDISLDEDFNCKAFLMKEKGVRAREGSKEEKKLVFLNKDGSVKKEVRVTIKEDRVVKKTDDLGRDVVAYEYGDVKFSKSKKLIARKSRSNERERRYLEGSAKFEVTIYDSDGLVLFEKSGIENEFPLFEVFFSDDDKVIVLYFYHYDKGEWLKFYDTNGEKINEYYPPKQWGGLHPIVTDDNGLLIKSVIVYDSEGNYLKDVNLRLDFQGNVIDQGAE